MAPKTGITWDAEADRKILLALLKDGNVTAAVDWDALAEELSTDTATCTVAALRKHISRLRVASKGGQDNDDGSDSPAPKTPTAKGKGKRTAASTATPKSKGKGKAALKRTADDSDEEGISLNKKIKKVTEGAEEDTVQVKAEGDEDDA